MNIYDLEENIMNCWNTESDIKTICDNLGEMNQDEIKNTLVGLAGLHELRCKKLFDVYEKLLRKENKNDY